MGIFAKIKCNIDLPDFKLFLERKGLKQTTIKKHFNNLRLLSPYLTSPQKFLDKLREENKSSSYICDFVCLLRRIGQFTNNKKFKTWPLPPKKTKYIRATMSDEEIEAFLALKPIKNQDKKRFKLYQMFFRIMALTAMRPGEVANLTINQVDFGRNIFLIEDTKTNRPRIVPIPPVLQKELADYISHLEGSLLFPKQHSPNKPINNVDWQYQFATRINRLGIKRSNLVPYSLRHSFATRMIEADVNIFKVKSILGHSNIKTTEIYYHTSTKALQETIKQDPLSLKYEGKIICPFCKGKGFVINPNPKIRGSPSEKLAVRPPIPKK